MLTVVAETGGLLETSGVTVSDICGTAVGALVSPSLVLVKYPVSCSVATYHSVAIIVGSTQKRTR